MNERTVPTALNVIAILFLISGIGAVVNIIIHLAHDSIHFDFGVLGISIFFGLRSFSRGWRTCALVFTWGGLVLAPFVSVFALTITQGVTLHVFGIRQGNVSPLWLSAAGVLYFLFALWQYHVLTRPDIRALFYPSSND